MDLPPSLDNLGVLLWVPYRALEIRVHAALAEAGFADITPAQGRVFANIGREGTRLTELAARAQVSKQNASVLVDQLERAGYVRRVPDPADGRARLVQVAERGAASVPVVRATIAEVEAEWTASLGEQGMNDLRSLLARLHDATADASHPG
jgi:DNA-binding MarR family transcriptional regulator